MNTNKVDRTSLDLNWSELGAERAASMDAVLHVAIPNEKTWALWKSHKDAMRQAGFRIVKSHITGYWEIQWRAANSTATEGMIIEEARALLFECIEKGIA